MLQIGLRAHDYGKNVSIQELADILFAYKPAAIQLSLSKALSDAPGSGQLSPGYARRVKQTMEERNISIAVLGCYINPVHPDTEKESTFDMLCNFLERLLKTAEKCSSIVAIEGVADQHTVCTEEMDYKSLLRIIMERKPGIDILLEDTSPATGMKAMEFLQNIAAQTAKA